MGHKKYTKRLIFEVAILQYALLSALYKWTIKRISCCYTVHIQNMGVIQYGVDLFYLFVLLACLCMWIKQSHYGADNKSVSFGNFSVSTSPLQE